MRTDRTRRSRRTAGLAILLGVVLLACPWASQADVYHPYPGLPNPSFEGSGSWGWVAQGGIAETAKARQWVAVAPTTVGYWSGQVRTEPNPEPGVVKRDTFRGEAFFVTPPGTADHPYGHLPRLRVRTVGFGLLPVEAVVEVSQRRAGGRPIPVVATIVGDRLDDEPGGGNNGSVRFYGVHIEDAFEVRVTQVLVDGVDIGLKGTCRTVRPAPVEMTGAAHVLPVGVDDQAAYYESLDPATYFHPTFGGQLTGTLDLPPFTGCTTSSGDDLSPMITLSVSGPGNRAVFEAGRPCALVIDGSQVPPAPGEWDVLPDNTTGPPCTMPDPMPYPARPGG